jgi:hypothetical protein
MATYKDFSMDEEFADLDFNSIRLKNRFIRTIIRSKPCLSQ